MSRCFGFKIINRMVFELAFTIFLYVRRRMTLNLQLVSLRHHVLRWRVWIKYYNATNISILCERGMEIVCLAFALPDVLPVYRYTLYATNTYLSTFYRIRNIFHSLLKCFFFLEFKGLLSQAFSPLTISGDSESFFRISLEKSLSSKLILQ